MNIKAKVDKLAVIALLVLTGCSFNSVTVSFPVQSSADTDVNGPYQFDGPPIIQGTLSGILDTDLSGFGIRLEQRSFDKSVGIELRQSSFDAAGQIILTVEPPTQAYQADYQADAKGLELGIPMRLYIDQKPSAAFVEINPRYGFGFKQDDFESDPYLILSAGLGYHIASGERFFFEIATYYYQTITDADVIYLGDDFSADLSFDYSGQEIVLSCGFFF